MRHEAARARRPCLINPIEDHEEGGRASRSAKVLTREDEYRTSESSCVAEALREKKTSVETYLGRIAAILGLSLFSEKR
jgi:hypothetical protein